jgi:hypothetical protein
MDVSRSKASAGRVSIAALDLSRAIPAQVERALASGSAKMLGESFLESRPPVADYERFPHYSVPKAGVDVVTTAYLIHGKVYAREHHASGGFNVWFDCGKAPSAPAL